ncbi:HAMP domain-containing histidine kinase [Nodosilinea sp. LEGE 07088]|uniref:sensor histidine kinase n=1 Tax=Nodosilinea sp. LEGE 07088 TaxID=2777968 RepID=UPI0019FCBB3F|nr:HAMP domain-containing sensor histidine kinase [Nodosilinea sp. LEGE 07088]MBE9137122.1 HAMP domain-containing histidine kinase [Nodosilinea sp. LEGE 07088]
MQQFRPLSQLLSEYQTSFNSRVDDVQWAYGAAQTFAEQSPGFWPQAQVQAEQEWLGGLAALIRLLLELPTEPLESAHATGATIPLMGGVLSGPFPVLPDRLMGQRLIHWLLVPEQLEQILLVTQPLLPGQGRGAIDAPACNLQMVPLASDDPLVGERFSLLLTNHFSLLLVLGHSAQGLPQFHFSFDPDVVWQGWQQLRDRVAATRPPLLTGLDRLIDQFPPVAPDYRLVTRYGHLLLTQLRQRTSADRGLEPPAPSPPLSLPARPRLEAFQTEPTPHLESVFSPAAAGIPEPESAPENSADTELLKAMAHEIRTPLTTIRTLTRSLLKRPDISDEVTKRLRLIDRECTQQIDRFSLIFRAVELETDRVPRPRSPLSAISLNQIFDDAIPRWQQQASRRNLSLTVNVPPCLPMVNSDPAMLTQVLTGLIDRFTHSLPPYSHIELAVTLAGHQLKLQFQSQPPEGSEAQLKDDPLASPFKALGQLLMFQPETGGLSLNLNATKNLFQALGGKLIVRQRPQAGEVLTVFLPLEPKTL